MIFIDFTKGSFSLKFVKPLSQAINQQNKHIKAMFNIIIIHIFEHFYFLLQLY